MSDRLCALGTVIRDGLEDEFNLPSDLALAFNGGFLAGLARPFPGPLIHHGSRVEWSSVTIPCPPEPAVRCADVIPLQDRRHNGRAIRKPPLFGDPAIGRLHALPQFSLRLRQACLPDRHQSRPRPADLPRPAQAAGSTAGLPVVRAAPAAALSRRRQGGPGPAGSCRG